MLLSHTTSCAGQVLCLQENKLRSLPPEIGGMARLAELAVFKNELDAIPKELGQLTALTTLGLHVRVQ